jgi:Rieske Fe-S protein
MPLPEMDSNLSSNTDGSPDQPLQDSEPDRRSVLAAGSSLLMAAGLVGGYGTFFTLAGRYLFPSGSSRAWMFVTNAAGIEAGQSFEFKSPTGVQVTITRDSESTEEEPTAESFLALSSVCPHLGCRVQWEGHNDRFFCPCHNGVFDPSGKAVSGPPAADGQDLSRYPLQVVDGALYIEMPYSSV